MNLLDKPRTDRRVDLRSYADTILFETTVDIIKQLEKPENKNNPKNRLHEVQSELYQEFWNRDKAPVYSLAHNIAMKQLGRSLLTKI